SSFGTRKQREIAKQPIFQGVSLLRPFRRTPCLKEGKRRKKGAHYEKVHNLTALSDLAWLSFHSLVFYELGGSIRGSHCVGPAAAVLRPRGERADDGLENRGDRKP